ncbi:hypothetical protein PoB_005442500 [Plakobranchus ocellatus]|uniref:Uncharacterized protein n=1 Tax=Plakobranchus ocellatus TaxID=259542 RepID=A0AAV4C8C3_9GAST|nr:hypothetical protein PoB_005442500 [Plakobranchus ocellatus]
MGRQFAVTGNSSYCRENRCIEQRVNPAAARQTLTDLWRPPGRLQGAFGGRLADSRLFLAAATLTLECFLGRVILASYTGTRGSGIPPLQKLCTVD